MSVHLRVTKSGAAELRHHAVNRLAIVLTLSLLPVSAAWSQASSELTAAAERLAGVKKAIGSNATIDALRALDEAEKTLQAARVATSAADSHAKLLKLESLDKPGVLAASTAAATEARKAATSAETAVGTAAIVTETITIAAARAKAAEAGSSAVLSSRSAAAAAGKTEETNAHDAAAATDDAVHGAADSVVKEATATVTFVIKYATLVADAALEAARPSLPVTGLRDENTLEALRVRMTGGSIFFRGTPEIIDGADGKSATVRSGQFAQAAVYLSLGSEPRLFSFNHFRKCRPSDAACVRRASGVAERGFDRYYIDPVVGIRMPTIPEDDTVVPTTGGSLSAPSASVM